MADGLQDDVGALPVGHAPHLLDALLTALSDHVGSPEVAAQVGAVGVTAHQDDPVGTHPGGGQHSGQPHCAVADHRHRLARLHLAHEGGVVAG